ncbi:acyl carrier protein [Streptomyces sp. T-3]|nr:acyl carrier protein [Streptomyces sp. T-3]
MTTSATSSSMDLISSLLIDKFEVEPAAVQPTAPMTDLLIDSLMAVEMAITLKDELGITVGEDELRNLNLGEFVARLDELRTRA